MTCPPPLLFDTHQPRRAQGESSRAEPLPNRTAPGIIAAASAAASAGISRSPILNLPWEAFSLPLLGIKLLFILLFLFFLPGEKGEHRGL